MTYTHSQLEKAIAIAKSFKEVNEQAKNAGFQLGELKTIGSYFITDDERAVLHEADKVLDRVRNRTTEWEASKYIAAEFKEEKEAV